MPSEDTSTSSPNNMATDRLRKANEQLTLKALQSHEQAEETKQRYLDQNEVNKVLVRQQQQLRTLASELILTEHRERKRLATELHDYLAQMLVLGRLKIEHCSLPVRGKRPGVGQYDRGHRQDLHPISRLYPHAHGGVEPIRVIRLGPAVRSQMARRTHAEIWSTGRSACVSKPYPIAG